MTFQTLKFHLSSLIDEWIHNDRDREIMRHRLVDGWTHERIAEAFDLSVQRVKSICYKSLDKLADKVIY